MHYIWSGKIFEVNEEFRNPVEFIASTNFYFTPKIIAFLLLSLLLLFVHQAFEKMSADFLIFCSFFPA